MADYDFTTMVDRTAMGSAKWQFMREASPHVPEGIAPLDVADLDMYNAPEIMDGLRETLRNTILGYTLPTESYFDAVLGWMSRHHDWEVRQEWVCLTPGVVPAIFTAVRAFAGPDEGVIMQTPVYYPFYKAVEMNGRRLVRNPLKVVDGRYRIDFDQLEELARSPQNKVLLFCSPHNPSARVWEREELQRVAEIAIGNDLVLVSDEIHFDIVMPGHKHTVAATISDELAQRTLVCTAPSKTFNLAGMSASNVIIPNEKLRNQFTHELESTGFLCLTTLAYRACELAYTKGEAWLDGLLHLIENNRRVLKDYFAQNFPDLTVFDLEGTYLQWVDFRPLGLDADELERINTDAHLFLGEGKVYGEEGAGFERIQLATPTHVLEDTLERLGRAYRGIYASR